MHFSYPSITLVPNQSLGEDCSYLKLFMATSTVALFIAHQLVVLFVFPLWPLVRNCFLTTFLFFHVGKTECVMIAIQT